MPSAEETGNWLWMLWQSPAHPGLPSGIMARRHHRIRSCIYDGEGDKFSADSIDITAIPPDNTTSMRFIPLASNHLGRRGWHFQALLLETAISLDGYPLMILDHIVAQDVRRLE